jgi:hypothetical protein
MDYMYIGKIDEEPHDEPERQIVVPDTYTYILVIKDHFSGYVELIPCTTCDSESAAIALQWWIARFATPEVIISDRGTHFTAKIIKQLAAIMGIALEFTIPYCPWSNGAVERVNRDIKALLKILMRTSDEPWENWFYFLPAVMRILNETPSDRLGHHAPKEIFLGFEEFNPLKAVFHPRSAKFTEVNHTIPRVEQAFRDLKTKLEELGTISKEQLEAQRVASGKERLEWRKFRAKELGIPCSELKARNLLPNFANGDFVMAAMPYRSSDHKLMARWRGPYRIVNEVTKYEYEVEHIVTGEVTNVHIRRLKYYADKELDLPIEISKEVTSEDVFNKIYEVEEILDIKYNPDAKCLQARVKWAGFHVLESTWQDFNNVYKDAPDPIMLFVDQMSDDLLLKRRILRAVDALETAKLSKKKNIKKKSRAVPNAPAPIPAVNNRDLDNAARNERASKRQRVT